MNTTRKKSHPECGNTDQKGLVWYLFSYMRMSNLKYLTNRH